MSKLLKLYIQKMLVVKGSNFVHGEKFLPISQILIFSFIEYKVFKSFGLKDLVLVSSFGVFFGHMFFS